MAKRFLVLIALLSLGFFIAGCAEGDKSSNVVNPNPDVFSPTGSISGQVFDFCKMLPVQGAIVSVAYNGSVKKVTTGKDGGFSFNNVPANGGWYGPGAQMLSYVGAYYEVVCDLSNIKSSTGAATYGYATIMPAYVTYSDLYDGDNDSQNDQEFTESGSGASTPVNKLAANVPFLVAQPNATINATVTNVTDVETGVAITGTAVSDASVLLYKRMWIADERSGDSSDYIDELVGAFTAGTTAGSYVKTGVVPVNNALGLYETEYYVKVLKAGFATYSHECSECIGSDDFCQPGCNESVSMSVNLIASAAADTKIPYITSIDVGTKTDVISGDVEKAWTTADVTAFVVKFNEAMKVTRSTKCNAIYLHSKDFTVTVTSAGTDPEDPVTNTLTGQDIVADYTLAWSEDGKTLTVTPVWKTAADWATAAGYGSGATFVIDSDNGGSFELEFMPGNPHFTDANLIPWAPLGFSGYSLAAGSDYQTDYLLIQEDYNPSDWEEWYLWFGIGDQCDNAEYANLGVFDYSCEW